MIRLAYSTARSGGIQVRRPKLKRTTLSCPTFPVASQAKTNSTTVRRSWAVPSPREDLGSLFEAAGSPGVAQVYLACGVPAGQSYVVESTGGAHTWCGALVSMLFDTSRELLMPIP